MQEAPSPVLIFAIGPGQVGRVAGKVLEVKPVALHGGHSATVPWNTFDVQENVLGSSSPSVTAIVIAKKAIPE